MHYGGGGSEEIYDDDSDRRRWMHPVSLGILAIALFSASFVAFVFVFSAGNENNDASDDLDSPAATTPVVAEPDSSSESEDQTEASAINGGQAPGSPPAAEPTATMSPSDQIDGPFVDATLNLDAGIGPGVFQLSGRVPNEELAAALIESAERSYAPFVQTDIEVDPSMEAAPWLERAPLLIGLLPSVTDGTIRVVDGRVQLAARSPNPQYLALLEGALTAISEMPVDIVEQTITDLAPPEFYVEVDDGEIVLRGAVPSEEIRQILEGGAAAAYGPDNLTSQLEIDDGTYISFWMYTMPGIFQLFAPFSGYQLQVVDGVSSGSLQGGVNFATDSTAIGEQTAQVLNIGATILARDLSLFMTVEGHTDSTGPDDYNMALSEGRAQSVVAYLVAAGISPERMTAKGMGEAEPVGSNDVVEGRATNRRVEFLFGPPPSG